VKNKDLFLRFLFFTTVSSDRDRKPEARVPKHGEALRRGHDHLVFEKLCFENT